MALYPLCTFLSHFPTKKPRVPQIGHDLRVWFCFVFIFSYLMVLFSHHCWCRRRRRCGRCCCSSWLIYHCCCSWFWFLCCFMVRMCICSCMWIPHIRTHIFYEYGSGLVRERSSASKAKHNPNVRVFVFRLSICQLDMSSFLFWLYNCQQP